MSPSKLNSLRLLMQQSSIDAFILPCTDEYLNEYVAPHNQRLNWVCDFSGSNGILVITEATATLFTDGRYTQQAFAQLNPKLFDFCDIALDPILEWLEKNIPDASIGFDPKLHSYQWIQKIANFKTVALSINFVDMLWHDRPALDTPPLFLLESKFTGQSTNEKSLLVSSYIKNKKADACLITSLDSICWLLNMRGNDIPYLPVFYSTVIVYDTGLIECFTNLDRITPEIYSSFGNLVTFKEYRDLESSLSNLGQIKLLADFNNTNFYRIDLAVKSGTTVVNDYDPIIMLKACKNSAESQGMHQAHIQDGIAVCRFLSWLSNEFSQGNLHDEAILAEKIDLFRQKGNYYKGPSFATISASGANASMPHYNFRNSTASKLENNNVYLFDSGGQYLNGTTDITRTVAVGTLSKEIIHTSTLALKGLIALSCTKFPHGTTGIQLDILARQFLWQEGLDYNHGTGHGVGHFLSVHEGPQRISKTSSQVPLVPSMVVSNEPGYYKENSFGIRHENLLIIARDPKTKMYKFDELTFVPFDMQLVDISMLTESEKIWLNDYHLRVFTLISPYLEGQDKIWLQNATAAI